MEIGFCSYRVRRPLLGCILPLFLLFVIVIHNFDTVHIYGYLTLFAYLFVWLPFIMSISLHWLPFVIVLVAIFHVYFMSIIQ